MVQNASSVGFFRQPVRDSTFITFHKSIRKINAYRKTKLTISSKIYLFGAIHKTFTVQIIPQARNMFSLKLTWQGYPWIAWFSLKYCADMIGWLTEDTANRLDSPISIHTTIFPSSSLLRICCIPFFFSASNLSISYKRSTNDRIVDTCKNNIHSFILFIFFSFIKFVWIRW